MAILDSSQDPSTSMLDGYGSTGVPSGSATCQQLDQMLVRFVFLFIRLTNP